MNNQTEFSIKQFFPPGATIDLLAITFLWGLAIILVNPSGDFPLADDWSFGIAVKRLIEEGSFHPTGWTSMSLITQVLWGALFCIPFGFSFFALRISTLVISLFCIFSFYLLIRQLGRSRWLAIFVTLTLAFNPIYFALSYTFMSDVPFLAFTTIALLFLMQNIRYDSHIYLLVGSFFTVLAVLCRQNGLFVPIAFGLTLLVKYGFKPRYLFRAVLPTIFGLGALLGFQYWLEATGKTPELYGNRIIQLWYIINSPELLLTRLSQNSFIALLYLGLFLLPILVLLLSFKEEFEKSVRIFFKVIIPISIFLTILFILKNQLMPLSENILIEAGIGPLTLHDTYILNLSHMPSLPIAFWVIVTILSIAGSVLMVTHVAWRKIKLITNIKLIRKGNNQIAVFFFLSGALVYFFPISLLGFFDRYLIAFIVLLPAALVCFKKQFSLSNSKVIIGIAIFLLLSNSFFSIASTHDYLSWNRTRWITLRSLLEDEKIPPTQIDGGFEFNGLYLYNPNYQTTKSKSWWWVYDDAYMLTFGEVAGYEAVRHYEFARWLSPHNGNIFVLKRQVESKLESGENQSEPGIAHKYNSGEIDNSR